MRRFLCYLGLLVTLGINLPQFAPCIAVGVNIDVICSGPWCTKSDIITEIGETLVVYYSWCGSCTLTVNTTRQNRIRLDIDNIYSLQSSLSYTVHDGIGTVFTEDLTSCHITFPTNELEIYMNWGTIFRISTEATNPDSFDSATNNTIVTDCEGLVHFDAEKEPDVNVDLNCSDPECTRNVLITEIGELLAVDIFRCASCTLTVNTARQNRIRLDIDNIYISLYSYLSYTVHDGLGTVFTEDLTSCHITFPTNELEINMDWDTILRISTEATNPDSFDSATNSPIVTDCEGLVHFDVEKEPDVKVDLNCSDPWCTKNDIITEIGELLFVDFSWCGPCTLTVNTIRQNRIRLDIYSLAHPYQSYTVHDGVGTVFTEDLTSCYIIFPANELEIYIGSEWNTRFTISTELTDPDSHDSASNTTVITDCVGLVHFNAGNESYVNNALICSNSWCTRNDIITEIGELLFV